jgi:hypothetical protein
MGEKVTGRESLKKGSFGTTSAMFFFGTVGCVTLEFDLNGQRTPRYVRRVKISPFSLIPFERPGKKRSFPNSSSLELCSFKL